MFPGLVDHPPRVYKRGLSSFWDNETKEDVDKIYGLPTAYGNNYAQANPATLS
jgi:hypothetical protein